MYRNIIRLFFGSLLMLTQIATASDVRDVIVYRDFGHKGDANQVLGVLAALNVNPGNVTEFNIDKGSELQEAVKAKVNPLVIAVGEKTVAPFAGMLPLEGATTIHLCHMVTAGHRAITDKIDYFALPVHAIDDFNTEGTRTKIIRTVGVAHNRQIPNIENAYMQHKNLLPPAEKYLAVILPGDATGPAGLKKGDLKRFSDSDAIDLAKRVAVIAAGRHIIVLNGPRTGKYNALLEENKKAHRNGELDCVTAAFKKQLEEAGVGFTLWDFQFKPEDGGTTPTLQDLQLQADPLPYMDIALGAIRATDSEILVPGESTSSISEAIDTMQPGKVIVYDNPAMYEVHKAHVESEKNAGRIRHLTAEGVIIEPEVTPSTGATKSAAQTIADVLLGG